MAETKAPDPDAEPAGSPSGLMTQREFAEARGWSKQYVNQLVKQGRIPLQDGKIDPNEADRALARTKDPARDRRLQAGTSGSPEAIAESPGHPGEALGSGPSPPFIKARTVRENYRALKEKLEYEMLTGKLIEKDEVRRAAFTAGRLYRDEIQRMARVIADDVAGEFRLDAAQVVAMVRKRIDEALAEITKRLDNDTLGFDTGVRP